MSYVEEENAVVVVQPFEPQGSIKDAIHKVLVCIIYVYGEAVLYPVYILYLQSTPALSWPEKYSGPGEPLSRERVARYGRQILEVNAAFFCCTPEALHNKVHSQCKR